MSHSRFDRRLVSLTAPTSFAGEQYQGLRLTVERLGRAQDARTIAVTSPGSGEGKTLTAVNLAAALARGSDARVLLVDADLRRPSIARQLGLDDTTGLADLVTDERLQLEDVTQHVEAHQLAVVCAGSARASVHRILRSPRLEPILQDARQRYAYVVLDTPPLLPVFDSALLGRTVDGVLVVVAANQTPRKLLGEALNLLDPSKVLGIVFNRDDRPLFGYYEGYYRGYFPESPAAAGEA